MFRKFFWITCFVFSLNILVEASPNHYLATPPSQPKQRDATSGGNKILFRLKKINVTGATAIDKEKILACFKHVLHQKISINALQGYVDQVTQLYMKQGYLLSHAYLPPQTIDGGIINIKIVEGFVDKIDIDGHITPEQKHMVQVLSQHLIHQRPFNNNDLEQTLLQINAMPGIQARAVLGKHKMLKRAANLTLLIKPLTDTYSMQWFNGGNTLNHNDLFNMAYTMQLPAWSGKIDMHATLAKNFKDHKNFVVQPTFSLVKNASILRFTLSDLHNKPNYTSLGLPSNSARGKTKHTSLSWQHMFHHTRMKAVDLTLTMSKTDTRFSNIVTNAFHDVITDFSAALKFRWPMPVAWFKPSIMDGVVKWSKGLNALGAQADTPSRVGGRINYSKINLNLHRQTQLGKYFRLSNHFYGQHSHDILLSSSTFSAGGLICGRGYDEGELMGDNGYCRRHQLEMTQQNQSGYPIVMYMFYDTAKIWNNTHTISNQLHTDRMSSNGFGIKFWGTPRLKMNFFVARPLNHDVTLENNRSTRYFFDFTYIEGQQF